MNKESNIYLDLKRQNRNKVFNKIREAGSISSTALAYELHLSRPTIKQNLDELLDTGYIYESGSFGHTGGRRAKAYSVAKKRKTAIGVDLTSNHITVLLIDLCGNIIYEKRIKSIFSLEDSYMMQLGDLIKQALDSQEIKQENVLGMGIAVPGLVSEDHKRIFYGEILQFTDVSVKTIGKYIPFPCRLYNDADAAGYAEISQSKDPADSFYISLSNHVGGAILIDRKVYKGGGPRSGEVGHMTIVPNGRECYCGQKGCFETYCNEAVLSNLSDGDLALFFKKLEVKDILCTNAWNKYLEYLSIAVNNVRMLFDCKVILGGYIGAYLEKYLPKLREMTAKRNPFENDAEYLSVCEVKREALALGGALPFIHEFWADI